MNSLSRATLLTLMLALVLVVPVTVQADENVPLVIESQVLVSAEVPSPLPGHSFMVQATSWLVPSYRYVLTIGNFTPFPMPALYVLDRFLPNSPDEAEIIHEWFPEPLEPGQVASFVMELPDIALMGGCHQIEIRLADGLDTLLMDCGRPGSTTVWNVTLTDEMEHYLVEVIPDRSEPVGPSKVGIHVTRNSSPKIMEFVRGAQPAVVVAVGDTGWLADVKAESPETVTLARFIEGDQSFDGDPVERARAFVEYFAPDYFANPGVDYWLGWNEPVIDEVWQAEWYATFEAERTIAMAELGFKTAIGNFSAGTPEANEFEAFLPAVRVAKEHGGVLAVHEYSAPTMRDGVGAGIPGLEANADAGALTLRYRFWYDHYLRANDLVLPLVITEAGIDGGVLPAEAAYLLGYRDFSRRDLPQIIPAQSEADYMEQLSWYDDELRRDEYVLGFAIFNVGEDDGKWETFDMTEKLDPLWGIIESKY